MNIISYHKKAIIKESIQEKRHPRKWVPRMIIYAVRFN